MMWNLIALAEGRWLSESFCMNAGSKESVGFSITGNFVSVCWTWLDETQQRECYEGYVEMWSVKSYQKLHLMKGDRQASVSIKTTARIIFFIMVKGRSSLLLSPRSRSSRDLSYDFLCWSEQEQIAAFSTGKKNWQSFVRLMHSAQYGALGLYLMSAFPFVKKNHLRVISSMGFGQTPGKRPDARASNT